MIQERRIDPRACQCVWCIKWYRENPPKQEDEAEEDNS